MKNLSSTLDQMGNFSTASVRMDNVTGVICKLPQKPAEMYLGFTEHDANIIEEEQQLEGFSLSVKIPKEASEMAMKRNGSFAGVLCFSGMQQGDSNSYFLNDEAVGIEMGVEISNLSQTIDITFANVGNKERYKERYSASCRSWDGGDNTAWITDGCQTKQTNDAITCQCSHLTFFAILLSPPPVNISASDVKSLSYITSIGCGLSSFFLAVALFMHFLMRKGKASQGTKILINLFIAMFALNVCFLMNESIANLGDFGACMAMGAALHYSMLATFTWFFMQALHLYINLHKLLADIKHYTMKICIAGWVMPAVVVITLLALKKYDTLVINTNDGKTQKMCWISDAALHQGVNVGYYAVVFAFTFSIFIVTVRQITFFPSAKEKVQGCSTTKTNYFSIVGLFLLLGITWAFAFFSHGPLLIPSYYIFTILNTFQGFFLFIYYYHSSKIVTGGTKLAQSSSTCKPANTVIISPYS
ncbi:adhesion G-protein coupled receptor G2-like [Parambassis ranga]|uniref:Adhesion G-protein coupled receptor G2-like n=1 Tax=Parambassis ranga TaxID=210632 RepID=A0A6P7HSU8_9TELE|nr:adhesion G-protein coupled receptor G2-like [Parambassis ranga]